MRPAVLAASLLAVLVAVPWSRQASAEAPSRVAALSQAVPSQPSRDDAEQQARWFYSTLTGEIAARTGHPDVAYAELLRAARDMDSAALFEQTVQVALQAHQVDLALSAVDSWLDSQPESERAQAWRVQLLLGLGRDADAAPAVQRLLTMTPEPQRPEAILALGGMFVGMQDATRALALARRSLAPYASQPQAQIVLGQLEVQAGEVSAGLARAAQALQADPALRPAALLILQHYAADPARADRLLGGYVAVRPDDDTLRMGWVDAAMQQQRDSVALAQAEVLAGRKPGLPQVWLILGSLQQQLGQARQAEHSLRQFLRLSLPAEAGAAPRGASAAAPASSPAVAGSAPAQGGTEEADAQGAADMAPQPDELAQVYLALSSVALDQGDAARAAQWLRHIDPAQYGAAAVLQQAKVLAAQGRARQAIDLVRGLPRASSSQRRQRLLALAELLQSMHEPARAYAVLQSGMPAWGHDPDYAYDTAMAADQAGQPARMLAALRQIVQQHADYQPALNALGYSLADQGRDLEQARQLIERALRLSPGNPFVMDSLGWAEFRLGRLARAQVVLEQAYAGRNDPEIGAHLAEVLWRRGQKERATALLRASWQAAPKDHDVLGAMQRLGLKF